MIELKNISKDFVGQNGIKSNIIKSISASIQKSKITSFYAPHGSGPSYLLKIISGLEIQTEGSVLNPNSEKIIYIPTEPSSFPWYNVFDNVKLGIVNYDLKSVEKMIKLAGLEGYESFHPHNKSYGFRFRIALARSLAQSPGLILMDDPFKLMDNKTKSEMYSLIIDINRTKGTTFCLASSNLDETLMLSDKIFLMSNEPSEIIYKTEVDLPAKRDLSVKKSDEYISVKTKIITEIKKFDIE